MKLVLIDGNAILHRAFHALPPMTTKRGEPINAVYGFVSMLLRVIQDLKPTHIIVCFDEKEKTFRHKEFANYQAQRPPTADELLSQFGKTRKFVEAADIPIYSKSGFEADDVIGTIAQETKMEEVVIVTGDRDQLQLVNDRVKVYMPQGGLSSAKLMGEVEVKEKMGVLPNLIDDYKALVGDPSDNYPGVAGIGPKTATSLLEKFGSFENIYKSLKDIPESTAKKLKGGEKMGRLSKKLATIVKNVPIQYDIDASAKWDLDNPKVIALFEDFGFKTLTERIKRVGEEIDKQKQGSLF